jgi:aryl-alcohol dehydrogenase-like predicted oxidoreductase
VAASRTQAIPAPGPPASRGENLTASLEAVAVLRDIANGKGCTMAQLAITWVISRGPDVMVLVSMTRRQRLKENLKAVDITLTPAEADRLDQAFTPGTVARRF